jgi:hypothetical protein
MNFPLFLVFKAWAARISEANRLNLLLTIGLAVGPVETSSCNLVSGRESAEQKKLREFSSIDDVMDVSTQRGNNDD